GATTSATKSPRPSNNRRSSTRRSGAPMPWLTRGSSRLVPGMSIIASPRSDHRRLLQLLPYQIEPLERRLVRDHEKIGIAVLRLVPRPGPVRYGEDIVL